jgi:predicted RNA-binding Zn-ribbon protein involved in translation (DUF1610 family)
MTASGQEQTKRGSPLEISQAKSHLWIMLKETPASRHAKRSQIVMGAFAVAMFIGFPIWFVLEATGHEVPVIVFLIFFIASMIGSVWAHHVKCPDCGALITQLRTLLSPTTVKTECANCGRSTSAPYESTDV